MVEGSSGGRGLARAWASLLVPLSLVLGLSLAACGGSSPGSGTKPASSSSTTPKRSLAAFTNCLKQHGVTLPSRGSFPTGGSFPAGGSFPTGSFPRGKGSSNRNSKFAKAEAACASLRPSGTFGRGPSGAESAALKVYLNCLSLHGVKISTKAGSVSDFRTLFAHPTAKTKAALAACASLRPKFTRPGGTTTTTTTAGG